MAGAYDPIAAAVGGGPMSLDVGWYEDLLATKADWELVETDHIRPNSGIAVDVPAGHTIRITQSEGPQINDINFFGADIADAAGERYRGHAAAAFLQGVVRSSALPPHGNRDR